MTQIFSSEFGEIRTVMRNNEPWFVGVDVANALGYANTAKAIKDHVDDEDKLTERIVMSGQNRDVILINESGLYSLIFASKLDSAKKFKKWVTSDVLPKLRKDGEYTLNPTQKEELRVRKIINCIELTRAVMIKEGMKNPAIAKVIAELCNQHDIEAPECFMDTDKFTHDDIINVIKFVSGGDYAGRDPEKIYTDYIYSQVKRRRRRSVKLIPDVQFGQ